MHSKSWILMLCAGMTLALPSPAESNNAGVQAVRSSHGLHELPALDYTRTSAQHKPNAQSLNVTHHQHTRDAGVISLDKRQNTNFNTWAVTDARCITPAEGQAPVSADCERLVTYVQNYHSPVQIGPLQIETWTIGHCAFSIANLDPCNIIDLASLSLTSAIAETMYNDCALNGDDAFVEGTPPPVAFGMWGLPSAPPYQEVPC